MGSRSRRRCCRESCTLDSRQAAAKRADPDRRAAVHAPQRSPAAILGSGESTSPRLSVRRGRRWHWLWDVNSQRQGEAASAGRHEFAAAAAERRAMRCSRDEAAAREGGDRSVEDAGAELELELYLRNGCWRSSGDAQQHTPTSRRLHTQSKFTSGLVGRVSSRRAWGWVACASSLDRAAVP